MVAKIPPFSFSSSPPVRYWFSGVREVGEVEGEKPD